MTILKWIIRILAIPFVIFVILFLHYTLPSRDIVQIVGTDVKRMDVGRTSIFWASPDAGTNPNYTRDVRFINAAWPDGSPRVYRNEDTNWNWPPYFKFDSGNLVAQSQALAKSQETVWVAVTHYGWRLKLFSIFPNAITIRPVAGPDVFLIPWFNIIFLSLLVLLIYIVWRLMRRFKRQNIDPVLEDIDDMMDDVEQSASQAHARAQETKKGFKAWLKRWFG